jgi:hypothetical protein
VDRRRGRAVAEHALHVRAGRVDEYPDGITERGVGLVLGVGERAARTDITRAGEKLRAELAELADEVDAGGRVGRRGL